MNISVATPRDKAVVASVCESLSTQFNKMNSNAYLDLVCLAHTEMEAKRGRTLVIESVLSGREGSLRSDREYYGRRLVSVNSC